MLLQTKQTFKHTSLASGLTWIEVIIYKAKNRLKTIALSFTVVTCVPHPGLKGQRLKERDTDMEQGASSCTFLNEC